MASSTSGASCWKGSRGSQPWQAEAAKPIAPVVANSQSAPKTARRARSPRVARSEDGSRSRRVTAHLRVLHREPAPSPAPLLGRRRRPHELAPGRIAEEDLGEE